MPTIEKEKALYRAVKVITPLESDHPRVDRIWETGSMSGKVGDDTLYYHIHIMLRKMVRHEFKGTDPADVFERAAEFLSNLPLE